MSLSMYSSSVPVFLHCLKSLSNILKKGADYAAEKKIDEKVLTSGRLYPDMFPLVRQFQYIADHSSGACLRLAGQDAPVPPREETTFEALKERLAKALAIVESVSAADVDAHASQDITFPMGPRQVTMRGHEYLLHFVMPNFYFHATTAYNILRHRGVEVGKRDFLGVMPGFPKA
jgi:hypothetical protein